MRMRPQAMLLLATVLAGCVASPFGGAPGDFRPALASSWTAVGGSAASENYTVRVHDLAYVDTLDGRRSSNWGYALVDLTLVDRTTVEPVFVRISSVERFHGVGDDGRSYAADGVLAAYVDDAIPRSVYAPYEGAMRGLVVIAIPDGVRLTTIRHEAARFGTLTVPLEANGGAPRDPQPTPGAIATGISLVGIPYALPCVHDQRPGHELVAIRFDDARISPSRVVLRDGAGRIHVVSDWAGCVALHETPAPSAWIFEVPAGGSPMEAWLTFPTEEGGASTAAYGPLAPS